MLLYLMPLFLFALGVITDFLWCKATQHATKYHPWRAGIFSALLTAVGLFSYAEVIGVDNWISGLMYTIGCGTGAFFTSRKKCSDNKLKV